MISHVQSVTFDSTKGRWVVRWRENGKNRAFSRAKEGPVRTKARNLAKAAMEGRDTVDALAGPVAQLTFDPERVTEAGYIKGRFAEAWAALVYAYNRGDKEGMRMIRGCVLSMSEIANASMPFFGFLQLEQSHEKLLDYLETHGHMIEREGAQELVPTTPGLAAALKRDTGPFDEPEPVDSPVQGEERTGRGPSN
jgi:hypothetical protein